MKQTRSLEEIERATDIYMQLEYLSLESLRNLRVSVECEMRRKRGLDPFTGAAIEPRADFDVACERIRKVLPTRYLGWNLWEAAADYIERSEKTEEPSSES